MNPTMSWLLVAALCALGCGRSELIEPRDAQFLDGADEASDSGVRDVPPDAECRANRDCNDGVFCNGFEECVLGRCRAGEAVNCDDGVRCTLDLCDEPGRVCQHNPDDSLCAPGRCDMALGCTVTGCTTSAQCDDRDPCTGVETCVSGRCLRSMPLSCDDGNGCTLDTCVPTQGCLNRPENTRCDDRNPCTGDLCTARGCANSALDRDSDGFAPLGCPGGGDCDDTDPRVNPRAAETCGDGRDNNCNGLTDCADPMCATLGACTLSGETCERPVVIGLPSTTDGSTAGRANDFTPMCASSNAPDVVYAFRNPTRQTLTIDTRGSSYDTMLVVFRNDCTSAPIGCDDDGAGMGLDSEIVLRDVDVGVYFVVVDGWSSSRGAFRLNVRGGGPSEVCNNSRDDDGDGRIDCADTDCVSFPSCAVCMPTGPEVCNDFRDNDCDRLVDCADGECSGSPFCCRPTPENNPGACADRRDNDCDGLTDCSDPECAMQPGCVPVPVNDRCAGAISVAVPSRTLGNTASASRDYSPLVMGFPGCAGGPGPDLVYTFTVASTVALTLDTFGSSFDTVLYVRRSPCDSGVQVACNDDTMSLDSRVGLVATPGTYYVFIDGYGSNSSGNFVLNITLGAPREDCANGRDDDGDGRIDCADSECTTQPRCCAPTGIEGADPFSCLDGRDNDCDGVLDCNDPGCLASAVCCRPTGAESTSVACSDGRDNDCDMLTDCRDSDCARAPGCCRPTGAQEIGVTQCTDGVDNDCDGVTDCLDSDCRPSGMAVGGECCNARDDNANGVIDEFACACRAASDCATVGRGGLFPSDTCWLTSYRICAPRCDLLGGSAFCARLFAGTTCDLRTGECRR